MQSYTLDHVGDDVLRRDLAASTARVHGAMAVHLAYIAEFDARRLYAQAGYSCMHTYCVRELKLSPDSASKRIQAARAARRFPALFPALAEGRISLSAVCELAPHLSEQNYVELMASATHRSKSEIREFLALRFGTLERPEFVQLLPGAQLNSLHAPAHVGDTTPVEEASAIASAPGCHETVEDNSESPPSQKKFLVQFTLSEIAHAKLRYAQALLSHAVPGGELAKVFERALDALIPALETRKFRARRSERVVPSSASPAHGRHVPAHIKRAVWERDQGQCTFVSADGTRCDSHKLLEFDHVNPVALGGVATVEGMRLRCHAHNQYEAERIFGAGYMAAKREEARARSKVARQPEDSAKSDEAHARQSEQTEDVLAGLRSLGCRGEEARRAAELIQELSDAPLEERMRVALEFLGKRSIQARTAVRLQAT